jgi:hypothetical protein
VTDEQTTDDLIEQINAHPRSALIEALADAMHSIEDDDGNGRHISYYRSLAFATVEILPALFYDEDALCDEPGCGAHRAATAAQLAGSAKDLARLARDVREELEGRRRELWGLLVEVACEAEETKWETPALVGNVMGLRSAYRIVTGIGTAALNELLAAELDSRYGTDRAKGGEPRG